MGEIQEIDDATSGRPRSVANFERWGCFDIPGEYESTIAARRVGRTRYEFGSNESPRPQRRIGCLRTKTPPCQHQHQQRQCGGGGGNNHALEISTTRGRGLLNSLDFLVYVARNRVIDRTNDLLIFAN